MLVSSSLAVVVVSRLTVLRVPIFRRSAIHIRDTVVSRLTTGAMITFRSSPDASSTKFFSVNPQRFNPSTTIYAALASPCSRTSSPFRRLLLRVPALNAPPAAFSIASLNP